MANSLEMFEELKASNLTESQARAIVKVMDSCVEDRVSALVTKSDFQSGLRELESQLEIKIEAARIDTLKWIGTLLIGVITIVLGGMYFMFTVFIHR